MDDTVSLTVADVVDLVKAQYAIITGGKTRNGYPIITFPDTGTFCNVVDEDYRKLVTYLTSVPPLQEADLGFVLIIDRRNDKWSSVKGVLLKISDFFPGLIQVVFVLRPNGIFQKAISEVSHKFFKEEFRFKVIICNCVVELHEHLDRNQLTKELDGFIPYNHEEWINQRMGVENFLSSTQEISQSLKAFIQRLQETELPNDADSTEDLLQAHEVEFSDLDRQLRSANEQGETLLQTLKRPSSESGIRDLCSESKLTNVTAVERLLVQLDETDRGLKDFWNKHQRKLHQCLELRRFEQDFRELQANLDMNLKFLLGMTEIGDSVNRVDTLIKEIVEFNENCEDDIEKAEQLRQFGETLIASGHYAVDSIQPKCVELKRMCEDFKDRIHRRTEALRKYRDLHERIEKANKWCARGVDLLASQQLEKCSSPEFAETCLEEIETFLKSSADFRLNNPKEFHTIFEDMITTETKALVQQVLKRIEDVQMMCNKRKDSLKKMAVRPSRPVQPVVPEPAVPLTAPRFPSVPASPTLHQHQHHQHASGSVSSPADSPATAPKKMLRKGKTVHKVLNKLKL